MARRTWHVGVPSATPLRVARAARRRGVVLAVHGAGGSATPAGSFSPARPLVAVASRTSISASDVGDYIYCARALTLRRIVAGAPDPAAAVCRAQGLPADDPVVRAWLAERAALRYAALADGTRAHERVDARVRMAAGLLLIGLTLLAVAAVVSVASVVVLPR